MIEYMRLQRFKCFSDMTMQFGKLTLLTGGNSAGKSSVFQSLLLLRQGIETNSYHAGLMPLNGYWTKLGVAEDVICNWATEDNIEITLGFTGNIDEKLHWEFLYKRGDKDTFLLEIGKKPDIIKQRHTLFTPEFISIGADRLGPQLSYQVANR